MSSLSVGDTFGKLTTVEWVRGYNGMRGYWKCKCDCGEYMQAQTTDLRKGRTVRCKSCKSKDFKERVSKDYNRNTHPKMYDKWSGMINRVRNHEHYLHKGIDVCDSWDVKSGGSFENFYKDMESSYVDGYSLDRIDNNAGYNKDNCRWIPLSQQTGNRDPFKGAEYKGIYEDPRGGFRVYVHHNKICNFLGKASSLERAKKMYDEASRSLRKGVTFEHKSDATLVSNECSLLFHEITDFKFYKGGVYLPSKSLLAEKAGLGYWFPSRSSVRQAGFDLRAVCRCMKGEVATHKGYTFTDLND